MRLIDKIAYSGFLGTIAAYYTNAKLHYAEPILGKSFAWTWGKAPELFTGAAGVALAESGARALRERFGLSEKIVKAAPYLAGITIMAGATIDELVYNISGGTQDPSDLIAYAIGVGTALGVRCYENRKQRTEENTDGLETHLEEKN